MFRGPMRSVWPLLVLAGSLVACTKPQPPVTPEIPQASRLTPPPPPVVRGPDMLPGQVLAAIEDDNAASYFARRADGALLFYSAKGHWVTRALSAEGVPKAPAPQEVAPLGADVSMASLKPVGDGYLAVWVELVAQNHVVKLLSLDADGKAKGEPVLVHQVTDDLAWIDVLPNAQGALVLWETPHEDRSDIFVVPITGGKLDGAPTMVAHDVIGWEAEPTARGAAIATVAIDANAATPAPSTGKSRAKKPARTTTEASAAARGTKLGKVFLTEVDPKGHGGSPVVVSPEATAQIDVTLTEIGGKYVIAWTDERNIDACVYLAGVEPGGRVATPPHRAMAPFGEQALVSLVAEAYGPGAPRSKRGLLAWEDQLRATQTDGRIIHLATVGPDAQLGKERAVLQFSAGGQPDIEPDGDGFAALTLSAVRDMPDGVEAHAQEGVKGDAPVWPSFVRLAPDLTVTAAEPLRSEIFAANDGVPYLARSLSCHAGGCTALGIGAVVPAKGPDIPLVPAPIALLSLPVRKTPWKAPAMRDADEAPPRPSSVTALFDGDHLARIAAADLPGANRSLVAWVTFVVDASGGPGGKHKSRQEEGQAATLTVRSIDGATPGKPVVVSKKASSEGGVAIAAAPSRDGKKPEAAVAWVQRERGETQVFVTRIGPEGETLAQRGVTTVGRKRGKTTSDASDVSIAYAGAPDGGDRDGWITAWIDTRDGNAEVYAARLDGQLNKVVSDQRITNAPGDAVEVQVLVRGKDAFLVWSDARANPDEGSGDIYLVRLDAATLKKSGPEVRLFASAAHSRTPQITAAGRGFIVSWIEEGGDPHKGETSPEAGLRIAQLDERGTLIGAPQLVRSVDPQAAVTSSAIGCTEKACRAILTNASGDAMTLGAFEFVPGTLAGNVKTIAALTGGTQDASPVFSNSRATSLFFADDAVSGTGRVRWMTMAWP